MELTDKAKEKIIRLHGIGLQGALLQVLALQDSGGINAETAVRMIEVNIKVFKEELDKLW